MGGHQRSGSKQQKSTMNKRIKLDEDESTEIASNVSALTASASVWLFVCVVSCWNLSAQMKTYLTRPSHS